MKWTEEEETTATIKLVRETGRPRQDGDVQRCVGISTRQDRKHHQSRDQCPVRGRNFRKKARSRSHFATVRALVGRVQWKSTGKSDHRSPWGHVQQPQVPKINLHAFQMRKLIPGLIFFRKSLLKLGIKNLQLFSSLSFIFDLFYFSNLNLLFFRLYKIMERWNAPIVLNEQLRI